VPNYSQPDFRNPITPGVTVQIEATAAGNPLAINAAVGKYTQGGTSAPAAPANLADAMGRSKIVKADGTSSST
jgi:hypothetical protein